MQVAEELAVVGRTRGLRTAAAYGGVSIAAQSKAVGQAAHPDRHARPAGRPVPAQAGAPGPNSDPHPGRGRPDARHGLPAAGGRDREAAAEGSPDDVLLGHARRRRRDDRQGLHAGTAPARGDHRHAHRRGGRAPVRQGGLRREGRRAGEAVEGRAGSQPGLRPHQARRRPPGHQAEGPRPARHRHARRHGPAGPAEGAGAVRGRQGRHAGGDRRRRPRAGRRGDHPRDQLRPAHRPQGLRPPRGPHGPRRAERDRHHVRAARAGGRHEPDRLAAAARRRVQGVGHARAPPQVVYSSKKGRRSLLYRPQKRRF